MGARNGRLPMQTPMLFHIPVPTTLNAFLYLFRCVIYVYIYIYTYPYMVCGYLYIYIYIYVYHYTYIYIYIYIYILHGYAIYYICTYIFITSIPPIFTQFHSLRFRVAWWDSFRSTKCSMRLWRYPPLPSCAISGATCGERH